MRDITLLSPRLLIAFVAIFEERSVTHAAARLNITQQGLSGALARLRVVFDDPLFLRIPYGVSPTPYSETIYPKVIAVIEGLKSLTQVKEFDPSKLNETYCIATNDYVLSVVIQPLFQHLRRISPNLKITIVPLQVDMLTGQMNHGQVDLALMVPKLLPDNLHSKTLFSDHYQCAVRKGHPLATRQLTIDEFCKAEHLLIAPYGEDIRSVTDSVLEETGHTRTIGIAVPSFLAARSLLATTDLLGILPSLLLKEETETLFITDTPIRLPSFDIVSVWSAQSNTNPVNIWMRELLHLLFGSQ